MQAAATDKHTVSVTSSQVGYLGTFTLDANNIDTGNGGTVGWSFSVSDGALVYLAAGQTVVHIFFLMVRHAPRCTLFPYTTLFRSHGTEDKPVITSSAQSGSVTEDTDGA